MKIKSKKSNLIIIISIAFVLTFSVGYALFSQNINVQGTSSAKGSFDVVFSKVDTPTCIGNAYSCDSDTLAEISSDKYTALIKNVKLEQPGSSVTIPLVVENIGNIPASLISIETKGISENSNSAQVTYSWQDSSGNAIEDIESVILSQHDTEVLLVTIKWDENMKEATELIEFSIKLNYQQSTSNSSSSKTKYKFQLVPSPSDAIVTLNGEITDTVEVSKNGEVHWTVSKDGYIIKTGTETIKIDTVKTVVLEEDVCEDWQVLVAATCTSTGTLVRTCKSGQQTKEQEMLVPDWQKTTVAPSYSGRGYNSYTDANSCKEDYQEQTNDELYLIKSSKISTSESYSSAFNKTTSSGFWSSSFGGKISSGMQSLSVSYIGNYGSAWFGPINMTDAKSVTFVYKQYNNLYTTSGSIFNKKTQKGVNKTIVGVSTSAANNTTFTASASTTYTRSSTSDAVASYTKTIDVSSLTGNYYVKMYVLHTYSGDSISTAYSSYTGFETVKITYK